MTSLVADRRLYVTADRSAVVEEGDPRGAWLLVAAGRQIGAGDVARYGMRFEGERVVYDPPGTKAAPKPEDKMAARPEDKAAPGSLPDDLPGRDELLAAGYDSVEAVRAIEDLTDVRGIGRATAAKIATYLEGAS